MSTYHFKKLLQNEGWLTDVTIEVDRKGKIKSITADSQPIGDMQIINGLAIPGFQNAHSHAFQYAMAGLAERHDKSSNDDFWAWRETMYQIALTMSPEDLEHVATMLYSEMVRHGYTHVAEFHYLHHDKNGKRYDNIAEHGERLISAAKTAGINITLVPMFYQKGGFGQPPQDRQRRFISKDVTAYFELLESSKKVVEAYEHAQLGWGIHSLRAVEPDTIKQAIKLASKEFPFHIHISEQKKEVLDAQEFLKKRPVEWLLDNTEVDERFHLVHATHLSHSEIQRLAQSDAHVVLCPSTEGNLGDGIFPLRSFQNQGGNWSIGTDSHIGLNPLEELRILDYGQRLTTHARNTFISETESDSGKYGITKALISGRKAMGNNETAFFKEGEPLNAAVYNFDHPLLGTTSDDNLASSVVYSADVSASLGTIVNGKWIEANNDRHEVLENFRKTVRKLGIR